MQLQAATDQDITTIALNVDLDRDAESLDDITAAVQLVEKLQLDVEHWFSLTSSSQVLEHYDLFSLPAALVVQNGQVVKKFDGEFHLLDDVLPFLKQQLAD